MQSTLVILAAGMASRYGSMKQTQGFGPSGETIMEYSVYDAIAAGFGKVIFIIREDFAENFKALIEPKLKDRIEIDYVYQSLDKFTEGRQINPEEKNPGALRMQFFAAKARLIYHLLLLTQMIFMARMHLKKHLIFCRQCVIKKRMA